ncbi:MAG: alpha/beta fold hydrolase [Oscillospiraceae bacterium]
MRPEKSVTWFSSADGKGRIAAYFYQRPDVQPFCVLQIAHGMCEYVARYEDSAGYLAAHGVVVCGNDHLGHGNSVRDAGDLGYFSEKGGRRFALQDMHTMNTRAREAFPQLPLVLLGHSMGSFFSRKYAVQWPHSIDGLILSGTAGPNPLAAAGIALAAATARLRGPRHRSKALQTMAFGSYLARIEDPKTRFDWVSSDEAVSAAYALDPLCNFRFTANGFHELFSALHEVSSPAWAVGVRKDMPVLMIQGDADPVGDYGRGTEKVRGWLRGAGVKRVDYKLYPGMRHEVLNEVGKQQVYEDVLAFLMEWKGA